MSSSFSSNTRLTSTRGKYELSTQQLNHVHSAKYASFFTSLVILSGQFDLTIP